VRKLLTGLNPHKAAGPDSITPRVLKELVAHDLARNYVFHYFAAYAGQGNRSIVYWIKLFSLFED
jgi:hypothetical protein